MSNSKCDHIIPTGGTDKLMSNSKFRTYRGYLVLKKIENFNFGNGQVQVQVCSKLKFYAGILFWILLHTVNPGIARIFDHAEYSTSEPWSTMEIWS